jgi:hypothetical protein
MDYYSPKANPDYSLLPDRGGQIFDGYPWVHHRKASLIFQLISHGRLATRESHPAIAGEKFPVRPPF